MKETTNNSDDNNMHLYMAKHTHHNQRRTDNHRRTELTENSFSLYHRPRTNIPNVKRILKI